jgi:hypothetical protein
MPVSTGDINIDSAIRDVHEMVVSEGGSLEVVELGEWSLKVRYTPGKNEDCPECVPTHDAVRTWLTFALKRQAPYVTEVEIL